MWKSTGEKLLDKTIAFNETHGKNNIWMFHCRMGLSQSTCGRYEKDADSRGAKSGIGGCASCDHRASANDATRAAGG